eukprot:gene23434-biopygen9910
MRTLLSEYLAPPLEDTAALELLKWVKTFTPPKDKIPAEEDKVVLRALLLDGEFHKVKYDVLAYLAAHVKKCVKLFRERAGSTHTEAYKGPFSAICQSSGMGKTRLALQLASLEDM